VGSIPTPGTTMDIQVYNTTDGKIAVTLSISKLDIMAHDREDKMVNYILMQIADAAVKEYMLVHGASVMAMITPELISKVLTEKIKESIRIGDK
jgi:hypothetical protein